MPFSSLLFISVFLPSFLAAYFVSPRRVANGVALLFSVLFYAWGAPRLLPVVLALGVVDHHLGQVIAKARSSGNARRARRILMLGVTAHLSVLAYFKYSNFLVAELNTVLQHLPSAMQVTWREVPLPIGISFLTFEEISYLVDVYRGDARPARSVGRYLLFLMLFPHSIAGPIFRWKDLEAQLESRESSLETVTSGVGRFSLGLAKKVLVADAAALAVDQIYGAPIASVDARLAWVAALAYTLQIYFDFSGYSDMAIGLGRMAGFRFKENFDSPYVSGSITDFWKRWHISLSTWLRDYLYVPLGGNRRGETRTRVNILIVFALSGLWHGAAWTFVVWGIFHGVLNVLERTTAVKRARSWMPRVLNIASTMFLVIVGWVFFRAPSMSSAVGMLSAMAGLRSATQHAVLMTAQILPARNLAVLLLGTCLALLPALLGAERAAALEKRLEPVGLALAPVALVLCLAQLVNSAFTPLIYFKF